MLRIRDVYPGFRIPDSGSRILIFTQPSFPVPGSRIPDSKTATKKRGEQKFVVIPFFVATNFIKIEKYLIFEMLKKKFWPYFLRSIELFTPKIVPKLSKIWFWDPGSGKNLFRIPGSKRHRVPDPDPQHCKQVCRDICRTNVYALTT